MPIFEFRCPQCESTFDKLIRYSQIKQVECPDCGQSPVERLLSLFASNAGNSTSQLSTSSGCIPRGGFS